MAGPTRWIDQPLTVHLPTLPPDDATAADQRRWNRQGVGVSPAHPDPDRGEAQALVGGDPVTADRALPGRRA